MANAPWIAAGEGRAAYSRGRGGEGYDRRDVHVGGPASWQATQQADDVVVRSNGKALGRDGEPISGSVKQDAVEATFRSRSG